MSGVNKVILIGNLGKDPELRYTPGGRPVASFSLATTERWNDRNGQRQDSTEWHNIVAWGKLAELANQFLKKGKSTYVEGKITTRSWDDRDGNKKYRTEIVASQITFLGGGGGSSGADIDSASSNMPDFDVSQSRESSQPVNEIPDNGNIEEDLPF